MKKGILFLLVVIFAAYTFVSCSSDDDEIDDGTANNEYGELVINGKTYICKASNFTGNDILSSSVDDVNEKIRTVEFMKTVHRKGEESFAIGNYNVHFEFPRINFDEAKKGDKLTIKSGLLFPFDKAIVNNLKGSHKSGNVTFEGLSLDQTLVRLSFNNVEIEVYDKESSSTSNYSINGSVAYRRNDISTKPDYPYIDINVNSQKTEAEVSGRWAIAQKPYEDKLITSAFTFNEADKSLTFYIQMGNKYGGDFSDQLNGMVGINLGNSEYANVLDYYSDNMASNSNCYVSGKVIITEIEKTPYLFMYPDMIFDFQNFTINLGDKDYTINGKSKVVYDYYKYY